MSIPASRPDHVRIATYNFENMGSGKSPEAMEKLASTLKTLDADVVAFEECKSLETLDNFSKTYMGENEYPYKAVFKAPNSGQNVGFMSRYPISNQESNQANGPFIRDVGEAQIDIPNYPLRMYVAHLKADPFYQGHHTPEEFEKARQRRMDEVHGILDILKNDMPSIPSQRYVVCGDLNAPPESAEMQALRDPKAPAPLVDPLAGHDGPETISHPATGHRYDYLMLSPQVAREVEGVHVYRDNPDAEKASDHLPLVMDIAIPKG